MELKGSKTEQNLKAAFAGESQANRRYLYFAAKADVEGHNDVAAVFRSTAEGETGHAHGHLEYLEACGDPATGLPFGPTAANLKTAIAGETHEYTDMYPGMAREARAEGFEEIADWFETLAKAERSHANRFQRARDALVLQMDMWAVAYLPGRKMVSIPLAKTGDSERRQMLSEYCLVSRNEKASGGVFDLTTS